MLDCETNLGPQMCPLKPRDRNLSVQNNSSMQFLPWPCLPEHASSEGAGMMTRLSNPDFPFGNSNPKAYHLAHYGAWAGVGSQSLFTDNINDSPSPGIRMMDAKQYLMVGSNYGLEVPYQTTFEN